jgi:hypothetical protein
MWSADPEHFSGAGPPHTVGKEAGQAAAVTTIRLALFPDCRTMTAA